jgi:hypothetical protein
MSTVIVNLTQHLAIHDIERVLETYPDHPYQQAFSHPDFRQQLIAWVLSRVPNVFTVAQETDEMTIHPDYAPYCTDVQTCLEYVIQQGIQDILIREQKTIEHYLPEEEDPNSPVSHWFG